MRKYTGHEQTGPGTGESLWSKEGHGALVFVVAVTVVVPGRKYDNMYQYQSNRSKIDGKGEKNGIQTTHGAGGLDKRRSVSPMVTCEEPASQAAEAALQKGNMPEFPSESF